MDKVEKLYFNIWGGCNLSCRHCFNEGGMVNGKILERDEIIALMQAAQFDLGIAEVQLTGGEPTQRPDLFEIIDALLGMNLTVLLQTNGVFDEEIRSKIMRLKGKNFKLIVSLDGIETNDFFRGEGNTAKTLENIKLLSRYFPVRINILLSNLIKWSEIEGIADLAEEFQLLLAFNPVCPLGRGQSSMLMPPNQYFDWMHRLEDLRNRGINMRKCFELKNGRLFEVEKCPVRKGKTLVVGADGNVYPCGFMVHIKESRMGNVRDTPLTELMNRTPKPCRVLNERCMACEYLMSGLCNGGCPARIYGLNGDFSSKELYCLAEYESKGMRE